MPCKDPARRKYNDQRVRAKQRGIEFLFEFEDWVNWWEEQLGYAWMKKRGYFKGQYVMARFKDQGAYARGNVKCVLSSENHAEKTTLRVLRRKRPGLPRNIIIAVFYDPDPYRIIAVRYDVTKGQIQRIKNKTGFRWITKYLDEQAPKHQPKCGYDLRMSR